LLKFLKEILSSEEVVFVIKDKIFNESIELLTTLGFACKNEEVGKIFENTGQAYFIRENERVILTPDLITNSLSMAPTRDYFIEKYGVPEKSFGGGGTATIISDKNGVQREPTKEDVINIMKIADKHKIPFMFRGVGPMHNEYQDVNQIRWMRDNYNGYIYVYSSTKKGIQAAADEYKNDPRIATCHSIFYSPLSLNDNGTNLEVFKEACKLNTPLFLTVMPISYTTAPATIYGLALQAVAENICGIVFAQILQPGIVCIPSAFPLFGDPRESYRISFGSIYHQVVNLLCARTFKYMNLPSNQDGCSAGHHYGDDTKDDIRRSFQGWYSANDWHQVRHCFGFSEEQMCYSIEQMKRDIAIMESVKENNETFEFPNPEYDPEAKDVIWDVCLNFGGNFMNHWHTLKHSVPVE